MKILTGNLSGRIIHFKPNPHLRPTSDKTRKAIFDMLQGSMEGAKVLDLFSGTGALGFEALSSGAASVTFVEIERAQARLIQDNLKKLDLHEKAEIVIADAVAAIQRFSREERKFDFIFLDPPYDEGLGEKTLNVLFFSTIIKKGALIILESRDTEALPALNENFMLIKNKVYGDTRIVIYRRA